MTIDSKKFRMDLVFMLDDTLMSETGRSLLPSQQAVSQWRLQGGVSWLILSRAWIKFYANSTEPLPTLKFCLEFLGWPDTEDVLSFHRFLSEFELK